jgi:SAM-dependent methyltransferase
MEQPSEQQPFLRPDAAARYNSARDLPESTRRLWIDLLGASVDRAPERIVDIGCGTGRFTSILHDAFSAPIIGIDPSIAMLQQAEATHGPIAEWRQGTADRTGLEPDRYDLIFMSQAYHHLNDVPGALGELARISSSRFLIRNGSLENVDGLRWLEYFPEALEIERRRAPPQEKITREVERAGFRLISMQTVEQHSSDSWHQHLERIEQRGLSVMMMIPDESFLEGCRRFREWVDTESEPTPVIEPVDLFVFERE